MHPLEIMIAEGEHLHQDFKFCLSDARKIARSVAAFASTDGGRLLIGVKDNGKIVGIKNEEDIHMIEAAAQVFCKPEVDYEPRIWEYGRRQVLEVWIAPSSRAPHTAPDENGKPTVYIRKADGVLVTDAGASGTTFQLPGVTVRTVSDGSSRAEVILKTRNIM